MGAKVILENVASKQSVESLNGRYTTIGFQSTLIFNLFFSEYGDGVLNVVSSEIEVETRVGDLPKKPKSSPKGKFKGFVLVLFKPVFFGYHLVYCDVYL